VELTRVERKSLWNQIEILKHLDPTSKDHLEIHQQILEYGYQPLYKNLFEPIDRRELTQSEVSLVYDVLSMFEGFQRFEERTGTKLEGLFTKFLGFSGNDETELMAFSKFTVEKQKRWEYLNIREFNSHFPLVDVYRRMVTAWLKIPTPDRYGELSRTQIDVILAEAVHPENR
jgi:uncharacterized protein YfbU (UPF0304 family)